MTPPRPDGDARWALEDAVQAALATYSNVHRGSGFHALVTTRLFEQARSIVLEHLGLDDGHVVVFCTPRRAARLGALLPPGRWRCLSSADLGLPLGVRALVIERGALPGGAPPEAGGGTARLVGAGWVVWARAPARLEPGTPAIINVIAFAAALRLLRRHGEDAFRRAAAEPRSVAEILLQDDLGQRSGAELLAALRAELMGAHTRVPAAEGERRYVNLDNAATTPTFAPIWEAVRRTLRQPAGQHEDTVQEVRAICARVLGAPLDAYEVVFTSGTTEAIQLAVDSLRRELRPGDGSAVIQGVLEHNSNELPWRTVPGLARLRLGIDDEGFVDVAELEATLRGRSGPGVRVVAVSGASNVLGTCNDLEALGRVAHAHGARLLVDAAQLIAHRRIDAQACGIDYLAFSGHKAYAPFGCGALLVRKGLLAFDAAERERLRASGEENVVGIAALGKALLLLERIGLEVIGQQERELTARLLRGLGGVDGLTVLGVKDPASPRFERRGGVVPFTMERVLAGGIAEALAERGIGVRAGCHCAHLLVKRLLRIPAPLERFQQLIVRLFPRLELPGVARVSLGIENTAEDVDALLEGVRAVAGGARAGGAARGTLQRRVDQRAADVARQVYG